MEQQLGQQIESRLRSSWSEIYPLILDRFTTVNKADLDAANTVDDLVHRIADKTGFTPSYVEGQVQELVGVGAPSGTSSEPFGSPSRQRQQFGPHR